MANRKKAAEPKTATNTTETAATPAKPPEMTTKQKYIRKRRIGLTPEIQKALVEALSAGNYTSVSCQYAGIAESTFYSWMERGRKEQERIEAIPPENNDLFIWSVSAENDEFRYVEFLEDVKKAECQAEVAAVAHIRRAMPSQWQAAATYLERKHHDRWGRKDSRYNVNRNLDNEPADMDLSQLSTEELEQFERLALKAQRMPTEATKH